jgi:hypothetical protein
MKKGKRTGRGSWSPLVSAPRGRLVVVWARASMKKLAAAVFALATVLPTTAFAALTASEKAVVRTFVRKGVLDTAPRVRALVARPDLTPEEIVEALRGGYAEAPFDAAHRRFTEALLFGPGSAASRNTLVPAVVEGLLARAAAKMGDVPIEAGARVGSHEQASVDELLTIHSFVDERVANVGTPPPDGHDSSQAIRDDALRAVVALYKAHLLAHERWFKAPGLLSAELVRVRAEASLALIDLGRGVVGRQELSDVLGLDGTRRGVFERSGLLVETSGTAPEARVAEMVRLLEGVPHAADWMSLWLLSKVSPAGLAARHHIVRAGAVLTARLRPLPRFWPEEVTPSFPDAATAAAAASIADVAIARSFEADPALRERARIAAEHASRVGAPGYLAPAVTRMPLEGASGAPAAAPTGERVIAGAAELLLLDGPRALDLAAIRADEGRPEPLEQLALALTVLGGDAPQFVLGRTRADGSVEPAPLTDVKRTGGLVSGIVLGGKHYVFLPNKDGIFGMSIDGAAPRLTSLPSYQERTTAGESWTANGVDYQRLSGEPRVAGLDDGRLVLEGQRAGFDSIVTGAEMTDVKVSALVNPVGSGGGLIVRARAGQASYVGVALILESDPARARLLLVDGKGKATELAEPASLPKPPDEGYPVSLEAVGDSVTAKIGAITLSGKVPADAEPGQVGVAARAQGRVDIRKLKVSPAKAAPVKVAPVRPKAPR